MFCYLPWGLLSWFNLAAKIGVFPAFPCLLSEFLCYTFNFQRDEFFGISGKFADLCRLLRPEVLLKRY
jgi:hypothetical protein